jgi:hypothetical protein
VSEFRKVKFRINDQSIHLTSSDLASFEFQGSKPVEAVAAAKSDAYQDKVVEDIDDRRSTIRASSRPRQPQTPVDGGRAGSILTVCNFSMHDCGTHWY